MGMRNAVDRRIYVGIAKSDIERYRSIDDSVGVSRRDCLGLEHTRPAVTPRYLTSLASFPTGCSGGIIAGHGGSGVAGWKWRSRRWIRQSDYTGSRRGVALTQALHDKVTESICRGFTSCSRAD